MNFLANLCLRPRSTRVRPSILTTKNLASNAARVLVLSCVAVAALLAARVEASAQTWSLTNAQRQSYLNYYAPVILKRADENNNKQGRDWMTNFDFDQDGNFSNNRINWLNIHQYVNASAAGPSAYDRWRIRPTMYTALIEYMEGGSKSLVLLYHVYNAADKDGGEIHDWERIEVVVRGVTGTPGAGGEYINHVTATMHGEQLMRRYYDAGGINVMPTATGKHPLIWQADESNLDGLPYGYHAHALWHVKTPYSTIASQMNSVSEAQVDLHQTDDKNVHYVFVPEGDPAAVSTWGATPLSYTTASGQASRVDNADTVAWYRTKRITYELQDLADILPTHWQSAAWYTHWLSDLYEDVLLESPIVNEAGQAEVSAGMQRFFTRTYDSGASGGTDGREGYLSKEWFWGGYSAELNAEPPYSNDELQAFEGLGVDDYGRTRGAASGYPASHNVYWWQHDFFVHSGVITSDQSLREGGTWLPGAWYTAANGGFDGRWVQLFADRAGVEPTTTLNLTMTFPTNRCADTFSVTARATGGQSPYTFTWTHATPTSPSYAPNNTASVYANVIATVTVTSADGQTRSQNFRITPSCTGGGYLP